MNKCKECGSYAINVGRRGRDDSDPDLCDVCYWRVRAEQLQQTTERQDAALRYLHACHCTMASFDEWLQARIDKADAEKAREP